ncbi:hypothetical protein NL493_30165, partial [Klebsiella pneumoniae]|nr:hypothetical protein [Klebsiella pneumoniae]
IGLDNILDCLFSPLEFKICKIIMFEKMIPVEILVPFFLYRVTLQSDRGVPGAVSLNLQFMYYKFFI